MEEESKTLDPKSNYLYISFMDIKINKISLILLMGHVSLYTEFFC